MTDNKSKDVVLMEFEQNPNIGIYMFANDKFCLLGRDVTEEKKKEIEKVLKVPVHKVSVLNTELIGIFVTGNNDYLFIPDLYDYEMNVFEDIAKKYGITLFIVSDKLNTIGNNMCVGDEEVLINVKYPKKLIREIQNKTGYKVVQIDKEDHMSIGSLCTFSNGKYFVSNEFEEKDVKVILKKIGGVGTVNSGSNYVSSGICSNSFGLIIGSMSTTVEIQNIVEALDFL